MANVDFSEKPPLDIEQALDLILAAASHYSKNDKHGEFGMLIINEYFIKLREDYSDDKRAKKYLDNLFTAVASAIRAISVESDLFFTRWESLRRKREYRLETATKLDEYSLMRKKGYFGKIAAAVSGSGLFGGIGKAISRYFDESSIWIVFGLMFGVAIGVILFEIFINLYREYLMRKVEQKYPEEVETMWLQKSLQQHKRTLKKFLLLAIKIREEYYSELPTIGKEKVFGTYDIAYIQFALEHTSNNQLKSIDELDNYLESIVEKHFAFG